MRTLTALIAFSALGTALLGAFPAPALADDASHTPVVTFQWQPVTVPGKGTVDSVQIVFDNKTEDGTELLQVVAPAGGYSIDQRADIIRDKLTKYYANGVSFHNLHPITVGTEVVVAPPGIDNDGIVTADSKTCSVWKIKSPRIFANEVSKYITSTLDSFGVHFRDAKFDYQLSATAPDGLQSEKDERAHEYCQDAQDAYSSTDANLTLADKYDLAESKYQLALALAPDYTYCKLQLANLYVDMKEPQKAKVLFQDILASATDQGDKDEATKALNSLPS